MFCCSYADGQAWRAAECCHLVTKVVRSSGHTRAFLCRARAAKTRRALTSLGQGKEDFRLLPDQQIPLRTSEIHKMANILVTGGAGYIGSHTCLDLSNKGFVPVVYDNLSNG